jgi:branched-chain amino acid transport system substrate-binding protein
MKTPFKTLAAACAFVTLAGSALAQQGEVVKIVRIDPLTGFMGPVGINQAKSYEFFAEKFSGKGNSAGVKFQFEALDNKLSPAESLNALKTAIDHGARYIAQGNGSSVTAAIVDAVNKWNERNPGKEVIYLNDASVDPDFTNSKCSYWHFRFDADTSMKMEAIASYLKDHPEIKKIYLLNQDYSHGHQVAKYAREAIGRKRPDIQFVGESYHPLAQVRDFAPYIAKIKDSGADTVITGNWGSDLSLMVKAAIEGGYDGRFFTYYAGNKPSISREKG